MQRRFVSRAISQTVFAVTCGRRWSGAASTIPTPPPPPRPVTLSDASTIPTPTVTAQKTQENSNNTNSSPKQPRSHFARLMREYGFLYAAYVFVLGEFLTLCLTLILQWDLVGSGDVVAWLKWAGLSNIETATNKSVHVFGIELSGKLAMNYGVASVVLIPTFPAELAFCAYTLPYLKRTMGRLWVPKRTPLTVPKAPKADVVVKPEPASLPH